MRAIAQLVSGEFRPGGGSVVSDFDPATGAVVASFAAATEDDLAAAVAGARTAAARWARAPIGVRAQVLAKAADLLEAQADLVARELTLEQGKTLAEALGELHRAAATFRYYSAEATREVGEFYDGERPGESILVARRPVGTVALVTPWNFPLAVPAWKIAPALVYGNCVVWKPSPEVPISSWHLAGALVEAGVPAGVLSMLLGGPDLGSALVSHPGVDAVSFTGSTAVGAVIAGACGQLMRPLQCEMGGKNAAIVLGDAQVESAVREIVAGAFGAAGQKCTATSRLILEASVADRVLEQLPQRTEELRVGSGLEPTTQVGPVISSAAQERAYAHLSRAIDAGARVLAGGGRYHEPPLAAGFFVAPTVVELADGSAPLWNEEVFGPVLAVRRAANFEEALQLANDSRYGLSGSVFTSNFSAVMRAVRDFDVGVLRINVETAGSELHVPFLGSKASGFGPPEQGRAAREFYTRTKTVYLNAADPLGAALAEVGDPAGQDG